VRETENVESRPNRLRMEHINKARLDYKAGRRDELNMMPNTIHQWSGDAYRLRQSMKWMPNHALT